MWARRFAAPPTLRMLTPFAALRDTMREVGHNDAGEASIRPLVAGIQCNM